MSLADDRLRALAAARAQSLTPEQVAAMDFRGTAALAGVKLDAKGIPPADFFWLLVRRYVHKHRERDRETIRAERVRAAMQEGARREAGEINTTVEYRERDGVFAVSSIPTKLGITP